MANLKKYLLYVLIIAAFWVFSDILIYLSINSSYTKVDAKVYTNSPEIIIGESKATYVNGVVKGSIKNNTRDIINDKYLKIELYSARDVKLGTKYVKIDNLESNKYQNFEMWYKFNDVDYANITVTDNIKNTTEEEFLSQETTSVLVLGTLLVLYFI
mgnify:CR=1 FL=1